MMHSPKTLDFVAIGVGPFNLGLACLTAPIDTLEGVFLDQRPGFDWHPGMLLPNTTLQVPFLADLVTLADPTSPFSFLNYLKQRGRIYSFYIREDFLLLRREYNQYCQWAVAQLPNIFFNTQVTHLHYAAEDELYVVTARCTLTGQPKIYRARKLVLGTGTQPYVPACCRPLRERAVHSSAYRAHKAALQAKRSITLVGSGQSAAEIFYDLLQDADTHGYRLNWITRSPRFFALAYDKLTLEMTSPEYVDYFYDLPPERKDRLASPQKQLYKGINQSLINAIYDLMYTQRVSGPLDVMLRTHSELRAATYDEARQTFELELHQREQDRAYPLTTEGLVLATGYHYRTPDFVAGVADRIRWDEQQRYAVHRNYSIDRRGTDIFVQNAELHTHGFATPDLGMAAYRNAYIIREMTGREHYPLEQRIAFQQFGVEPQEEMTTVETPEP